MFSRKEGDLIMELKPITIATLKSYAPNDERKSIERNEVMEERVTEHHPIVGEYKIRVSKILSLDNALSIARNYNAMARKRNLALEDKHGNKIYSKQEKDLNLFTVAKYNYSTKFIVVRKALTGDLLSSTEYFERKTKKE